MSKPTSPAPAGGGKKTAVEPKAPAVGGLSHADRMAFADVPNVPFALTHGKSVRWQRRVFVWWGIVLVGGLLLALYCGRWWLLLAFAGGFKIYAFAGGLFTVGTDECQLLLENGVVTKALVEGAHETSAVFGSITSETVSLKEVPTTLVITGKTADEEQVESTLTCPYRPDLTVPDEHGHVPQYYHLFHGGGFDTAFARVRASNTEFGSRLFSGATKAESEREIWLWARLCEANGRLSLKMLKDISLDVNANPADIWAWGRANTALLIRTLASHEAEVNPSELERLAGIRQNAGWAASNPIFSAAVTEAGEQAIVAKGTAAAFAQAAEARATASRAAADEADRMGLTGEAKMNYIRRAMAETLAVAGFADANVVLGGNDIPDVVWEQSETKQGQAATNPTNPTGKGRRGRRRGA